jgi:hypothetical protein
MEHAEVVTAIHEFAEFAAMTGRTLQNHREQLQRHEEILHAQFKAGTTHHGAIEVLRKDMQSLGQLVNSQSELIASMQRCLVRILQTLGMPSPDDSLPGAIN